MSVNANPLDALDSLNSSVAASIRSAQIAAHYEQVPAMVVAPTLGGLFSVWVLSGAVNNRALYTGFCIIVVLSVLRYIAYRRFKAATEQARRQRRWGITAIVFSALSGIFWGSAAVFLYPPADPAYVVYLVLLFALIPLAPVAALAAYRPTFYAYYIPCAVPFVLRLVAQNDRASLTSAVLLLMLMAATITFARRHYRSLYDELRLRLLVERQRDEVEKASASKSAFLAAASHDLRQPLHSIALFAGALERDLKDEAARAKQRGVLEATHALHSLLERLLNLSQLESGKIQVRKAHVSLNSIVQRLKRELEPLARERGLDLRVPPTRHWVETDADLIEALLRNLLANAFRYTHTGGVLLGCRKRGDHVVVQVSDTGVGVELKYQARIFDDFFQVDNPGRDRSKGVGLGLAVVKRIACLLGASLDLKSVRGRGSTFSVSLPAVEVPNTPEEQESTQPVPASSVLTGRRILFLDDDSGIRGGFSALVKSWGCDITAVATEAEALAFVEAHTAATEVMILDYSLQHNNGVRVAQEIERLSARRIPTLIITGDVSERARSEATAAGYLLVSKPLRPGNLKALITHLLGG